MRTLRFAAAPAGARATSAAIAAVALKSCLGSEIDTFERANPIRRSGLRGGRGYLAGAQSPSPVLRQPWCARALWRYAARAGVSSPGGYHIRPEKRNTLGPSVFAGGVVS
jgi:hypothetical protein